MRNFFADFNGHIKANTKLIDWKLQNFAKILFELNKAMSHWNLQKFSVLKY